MNLSQKKFWKSKIVKNEDIISDRRFWLVVFRCYFFPLSEVDRSFSKLLTRANSYRKFLCFFLANKPLGIVHWHAEIRRKMHILCTESSKKLTQIVTFSTPKVLDPLSALNLHLIINNALIWDQKLLNWRDWSIQ